MSTTPALTNQNAELEARRRRRAKVWDLLRRTALVLIAVTTVAVALPFLPTGLFREPVERAIESSLHRQVEVGQVRFTLFPSGPFPGPGFTIEDVTIEEDPRAGIEPFAYVYEMGASLDLWQMLRARIRFSSLNLEDASVNLVKTRSGRWNFQMLLDELEAGETAMPALRLRGGRVNFKFETVKSPFYFADTDLDVAPLGQAGFELRFGGNPTRSDQTAQDFGRFYVRGTSTQPDPNQAQQLDLTVELERSVLEEVLRLIDPLGFGVHGLVELNSRVTGQPSDLDVNGTISVNDIHRWDLLPSNAAGWSLDYSGSLDLETERLELVSAGVPGTDPVVAGFRAWNLLTKPEWDAGVELGSVPLATLFEIAEHMGATTPDQLTINGLVNGTAVYRQDSGLAGEILLAEASLAVPDQEPLLAQEAYVSIGDGTLTLDPTEITIGDTQSARVEAVYQLASRDLDVSIQTGGLSVAAMRSFGLAAIPVIEQTPRGTWQGLARYRNGQWTGASTLRGAQLRVNGLAEPIEIESAAVRLNGNNIEVSDVLASVGEVSFSGEYEWRPYEEVPHIFSLNIPEAEADDVRAALAPTLSRESGFLSRTLRLGAAPPVPGWLSRRRAAGDVTIGALSVSTVPLTNVYFELAWEGTHAVLRNATARFAGARMEGEAAVDLSGAVPTFHYDGAINGIPYSDGRLNLNGTLEAQGFGLEFLASLTMDMKLDARGIAVQDIDGVARKLDALTAHLNFNALSGLPRLSEVEVRRAATIYSGSATVTDAAVTLALHEGSGTEQARPKQAAKQGAQQSAKQGKDKLSKSGPQISKQNAATPGTPQQNPPQSLPLNPPSIQWTAPGLSSIALHP